MILSDNLNVWTDLRRFPYWIYIPATAGPIFVPGIAVIGTIKIKIKIKTYATATVKRQNKCGRACSRDPFIRHSILQLELKHFVYVDESLYRTVGYIVEVIGRIQSTFCFLFVCFLCPESAQPTWSITWTGRMASQASKQASKQQPRSVY